MPPLFLGAYNPATLRSVSKCLRTDSPRLAHPGRSNHGKVAVSGPGAHEWRHHGQNAKLVYTAHRW